MNLRPGFTPRELPDKRDSVDFSPLAGAVPPGIPVGRSNPAGGAAMRLRLRGAAAHQASASVCGQGHPAVNPRAPPEPAAADVPISEGRGVTYHRRGVPRTRGLGDELPPARSGRHLPEAAALGQVAAAEDAGVQAIGGP